METMNNQSAYIPNNLDDYICTTVVFGEVKKTIISKDFKGGKIHNFFGGTELSFIHADLTGTAILDISQMFGEIQIIVPRDWRVEAKPTQFCAVVDDQRRSMNQMNNSKLLILKGISFFSNIEISDV